ncbi:hypothetical protein [Chryseobacterium caseinilyticum]|uniref:Lipoprotein n=1 Tax=Chryseobacterium caseinilyticum TaxID=2771428 RepID=A0ABR8ZGR1_9FLAO|nr:hypothetical protein [Chryseobacterium caseinilyticum]MBD8084496.1 hypothetical protein [Chryseobacterium caseinilyticum]
MKKTLFFVTIFLSFISCTTNYYTVLLSEDTPIYGSSNNESIVTTVPKDTQVFISTKANKKNYKRIKWDSYLGWAYNPSYTTYSAYLSSSSPQSTTKTTGTYTPRSSSGGSVHVKGYTRKDGTYVRPHTRSAPRRR